MNRESELQEQFTDKLIAVWKLMKDSVSISVLISPIDCYSDARLLLLLSCTPLQVETTVQCKWILQLAQHASLALSHSVSLRTSVIQSISQLYIASQPQHRATVFNTLLYYYIHSDTVLQTVLTDLIKTFSQMIPLHYRSPLIYPPAVAQLPYIQLLIDYSLLMCSVQQQTPCISFATLMGMILKESDSTTQTQVLHYLLMQVDKLHPSSPYYLVILSQLPWTQLK